VDEINLAQYKVHWLALVNTVMKVRIPYKAGNFVTT
jgi:hypothetical protein